MKYTNLQYVQAVLSAMDSDEVNSVSDTTEAQQVLLILRTVYYDIVSIGELPRDDDLYQLTPSIDPTKPVTMYLPDGLNDIRWLRYNAATVDQPQVVYRDVKPMGLWEFIQMVTSLDPTETDIVTYTHNTGSANFTLYARNDTAPQYYTTTNDNAILFDSYDKTVDSTLQGSKTMVFGQREFPWLDTDNFVPPLDDKQAQRLLHEAKALAFAELKQSQHAKAEKTARDIKIDQQASKHKIPVQSAYDLIQGMGRRVYGATKPTGRYK